MKHILCFLLLITAGLAVQAQSTRFRFGLKAGANFSKFNYKILPQELESTKDDQGFTAGGQFEIGLTNKLALQPEVFYIQSRIQDYPRNGGTITTEQVNHLSVPVLVKLSLGHLSLMAGPQLSVLLAAKEKYTTVISGSQNVQSKTIAIDVMDSSYKKTNVAAVFALAYSFGQKFGIDLRYQQGLGNMRAGNGSTYLTYRKDQNIKLGGFQAGLYFFFGKRFKGSEKPI